MMEQAINAFHCQTYDDKELIIVGEGRWLEKRQQRNQEAYFTVPAGSGFHLGNLRNFGIANCFSDFVAQWDDDDASAATRLQEQIELLRRFPRMDGCYLDSLTFVWPSVHRYFISNLRRWECSIVARRERIPIYPALRKGEDTPVANVMGLVALSNRAELYARRIHGANTWEEGHFETAWRMRQRECTPNERDQAKALLGIV